MLALAASPVACLIACAAQLGGPSLPDQPPHTREFRDALAAVREHLGAAAPPASEREERECLQWMRAAAPHATRTLLGHHVIVLATEGFASSAATHDFVRRLDLGYRVLAHVRGLDPIARVGRRFVIWPDPKLASGHRCVGSELRIHVGRSDWDDAEWFERFFHELDYGFQAHDSARHLRVAGLSTGWAQFMQALVAEHLASLGAPFAGRGEHYAAHYPAVAQREYLSTPLPIEEIPHYEPAAGLLMELATGGDPTAGRNWTAVGKLLRGALNAPPSPPEHLWPARFAADCLSAFGADHARPILARYRFPLDRASLDAARGVAPAHGTLATIKGVDGWRCVGPLTVSGAAPLELDPLGAEDLAWRWSSMEEAGPAPPLAEHEGAQWKAIDVAPAGMLELPVSDGAPGYCVLATTLPEALRTPLTLAIATDGGCALWLDGELIHQSRVAREFSAAAPDIAYADARSSRGQIVALVASRGGRARFSLAAASGGLLFSGFDERFASDNAQERADAVRYVASRRHRQPVRAMLQRAASDRDARVRAATQWWLSSIPEDGGSYREAEDAFALGSIHGGYFGYEVGASGGQSVSRGWGASSANWLSLPLRVERSGAQRVRVRYACSHEASVRVRVRVGRRARFTSGVLRLSASDPASGAWRWLDVTTGPLEPGVVEVELFEPSGSPAIDIVGLVAR